MSFKKNQRINKAKKQYEDYSPDKDIINYYHGQIKKFIKDLGKVKKGMRKKDIHQLRLDIKRIKAFYIFLELCFTGLVEANDYYRPFKKLFKRSGEMRELQVADNYLVNMNLTVKDLNMLHNLLKCRISEKKSRLKKQINHFKKNTLHKNEEKIADFYKDFSLAEFNKKSRHYISAECNKLKILLTNRFTDKNIHRLRICVKDFNAIVELINTIKPQKKYKQLITELKNAGELIGNWHDKIILKELLEEIITSVYPNSVNHVQKLKSIITKFCRRDTNFLPDLKTRVNAIISLSEHLSDVKLHL